MIFKNNIIASRVVSICEELLTSLSNEGMSNGIWNTVINCINCNKEVVDLKSFYLWDRNPSLFLELTFNNYHESIQVVIKSANPEQGVFTASVIGSNMVISKPILQKPAQLDIDSFVYCNPFHNILYIDNIFDSIFNNDSFLSLEEVNCNCKNSSSIDKDALFTFLTKCSDEEKRLMKIANLSRWDIMDNDGIDMGYRVLLKKNRKMGY